MSARLDLSRRRMGRYRASAAAAMFCVLAVAGCSTSEQDPPPETLSYRSVPSECHAINDRVATLVREFLADVTAPGLPGELDPERTSKSVTPTSISCSTHRDRYGQDLTLSRLVTIKFVLATEPFHRPAAAVPVPLLGDSAHQQTAAKLGTPGAFSRVIFRVRNLEVNVTAMGDTLPPSSPDVTQHAETTALAVATELADNIDDLMPWPE
ncbi:hypothetical protein [Nocardia farcinica]|uniref:hypothetical protein n=1 Tax=Nocardia farcinica TaxID=37329 RepID=UPI0022B9E702|nr:hypothetical protein [Nocardia farcinica]MCZ9328630.1 hypothetical protein [Nocardia farcinica]